MEIYNITYKCGCVHEIKTNELGLHEPTGKNIDCKEHKRVI